MLEPDPEKRLTAAECLDHEFFQDSKEDNKEIGPDADQNTMDEFSSGSALTNIKDKYSPITRDTS